MVVPTSPVVPRDQDHGVGPVSAVTRELAARDVVVTANGVDDGGYPGRPPTGRVQSRMVRPVPVWDHPAHGWKAAPLGIIWVRPEISKDRRVTLGINSAGLVGKDTHYIFYPIVTSTYDAGAAGLWLRHADA